jgi:hypothetical protein
MGAGGGFLFGFGGIAHDEDYRDQAGYDYAH